MTTGSGGGGSTGGGSSGGGDLEHRVGVLERGMARMVSKIDLLLDRQAATDARLGSIEAKLEGRIALVDAKLDTKASATEHAEVKCRVMSLPTTYQMIPLVFGILGGAFLITEFGLPHGP